MVDQIWNAFWSGGIANPIEVIEQITYAGVSTAILLFTKTHSGGTDHVWFYDMQADGWSLTELLGVRDRIKPQASDRLSPVRFQRRRNTREVPPVPGRSPAR